MSRGGGGGGGLHFVIIGKNDNPLFEWARGDQRHMAQFIAHSALDVVDDRVWTKDALYLKTVDRFGHQYVSAYVTPSHVRFVLLHDKRDEDGIKNFFHDVHELYVKVLMNPFYKPNTRVQSAQFEQKVRQLGKKLL
mmetsp:Transcript_55439/g.135970  ORF Transcript_55439/g.135970 Transcript_55439/m.135970 type:complete len:136 (+) Transcript_55439:56-463(+)